MSPSSGSVFTLSSPDWLQHQPLAAGSTLELGYQMSYAGQVEPSLLAISFNGQELCTGGGSATTPLPPVSSTAGPASSSTGAPASTTQLPGTSSASPGTGSSCDVQITNSWANNVQGKLKFTVPADISDFTIVLDTDIPLTNIQVQKYCSNSDSYIINEFL